MRDPVLFRSVRTDPKKLSTGGGGEVRALFSFKNFSKHHCFLITVKKNFSNHLIFDYFTVKNFLHLFHIRPAFWFDKPICPRSFRRFCRPYSKKWGSHFRTPLPTRYAPVLIAAAFPFPSSSDPVFLDQWTLFFMVSGDPHSNA